MRAFLGIGLTEEVRSALAGLQRTLASSSADVAWVAPASLHVTLKFLGEITPPQREGVETLLSQVALSIPSFSLGVEGLGAFPSLEAPRVIWVGLAQGRERVTALARAIEEQGKTIPLRSEERPFAAHITLGRVRSSRGLEKLRERLRTVAWQPPPPWQAKSVTLYQSLLSASGARYVALADIPFSDTSSAA